MKRCCEGVFKPCVRCTETQEAKGSVTVVYFVEKKNRTGPKEIKWLGQMDGRLVDIIARLFSIFGRTEIVMHVRDASRVRVGEPAD